MRYTEDCEQQRGKGSFPAMITPAYQIAKRANELASDVSVHSNAAILHRKLEVSLSLAVQPLVYFWLRSGAKQ